MSDLQASLLTLLVSLAIAFGHAQWPQSRALHVLAALLPLDLNKLKTTPAQPQTDEAPK